MTVIKTKYEMYASCLETSFKSYSSIDFYEWLYFFIGKQNNTTLRIVSQGIFGG